MLTSRHDFQAWKKNTKKVQKGPIKSLTCAFLFCLFWRTSIIWEKVTFKYMGISEGQSFPPDYKSEVVCIVVKLKMALSPLPPLRRLPHNDYRCQIPAMKWTENLLKSILFTVKSKQEKFPTENLFSTFDWLRSWIEAADRSMVPKIQIFSGFLKMRLLQGITIMPQYLSASRLAQCYSSKFE